MIDLSAMKALEIDADAKTAWVETGITAGEYTTPTGEHGPRHRPRRRRARSGSAGITLAGGIGFLVRKNGLTIDDLLAAEVVTADGEVVEASEDTEPDLFWAIRGGEGNFGVATRFKLRLHEISEIVGGMLILPATPEVITGFLEAAEAAPEELSTIANVMLAPPMPFIPEDAHGKPVLMGLLAYVGPVDQGDDGDRALPRARRALRRHGAADALPGALRGPGAGGALRVRQPTSSPTRSSRLAPRRSSSSCPSRRR